MKTIEITVKDRLAIIRLNRGKSNALNGEMIAELSEMLNNIENDNNVGGVIITGHTTFFSAGLDLIELYNYDEMQTKNFWIQFLSFVSQITAFRKPMVAAINGHSPAGGCVLALACDARVMADGRFIIGLNEVPVGIVVPKSIFDLYSFWLGSASASRSLLEGKLFQPQEALSIGLVDEVVNADSILTAAEKHARKYMAFEQNTWQLSKRNIRRDLLESMNADQSVDLEMMLKQWWAPSTRNILKSIIDGLQNKSK